MSNQHIIYPNLSWAQFEMYNDNKTGAFEEMCKDLFICEYLKDSRIPHANHNNPGVEVVPIQEPPRDDGQPRRFISYQAKYFDGGSYCLNFSEVDDTESEVYKRIHTNGFMGVVGEGYSDLAGMQKQDRVKMIQGDRFDAVIYYYDVTPIRVLSY